MINVSKEFKEKLKRDRVPIMNYADVTLSDGTVLHLEPKDFMIGGCSIEDKTTDGKFGVGFCIGKALSIRLENKDERFSQYDFYQSIITLYVAMLLDDGSIEKIRKGVYYAIAPKTPGDTIEISAVDGMYRLDRDYSASITTYPATLQAIISDACLDCGIPIGFRQFDNMNFVVQEKPEKATYRKVVSWAAQIAGYNARIDNDGYMQLIWHKTSLLEGYHYNGGNFKTYPHDTVIDGGNFKDYSTGMVISGGDFTSEEPIHIFRIKSLSVGTDDVQITGVRVVGEDDKTALSGEEGYLIEIKGNPFVNGREPEIADYLGRRMTGIQFRPFSAQVLSNPLYEPFEVVKVSDRKGNVYYSFINSVSYKIGAYTQVSCQAEDPVRNGSVFSSPAAAAVVEARRNAEKQISTYDKAVQNMNQIAANAMGFHTTYEDQPDGSRITYIHDKPALEDSRTIYKQTIDGFFISTDGGKSYTAGFDKNGNAVVNILYAIGVVCDWIRGGTLTLGGDNNVNGLLKLLNSAGEEVVRADNTGLQVSKGNIRGTTMEIGGLDNANGDIKSYSAEKELRAIFGNNGLEIYAEGRKIGSIGIHYVTPMDVGLAFYLERNASYIGWVAPERNGINSKFYYVSEYHSSEKEGIYSNVPFYSKNINVDGELRVSGTAYMNGTLQANLGVYITNGLYVDDVYYPSDERLKKNIKKSEISALSAINEIQTYTYDWIETGKHREIGFIAQQMETAAEELVHTDNETGAYSINEVGLIPYLVKAVQELSGQLDGLKREIANLKGEDAPVKLSGRKNKWKPVPYTDKEKEAFVGILQERREAKRYGNSND